MYASHSLLSVNDSPTTDTYTLSLHDALPISPVTTATCSFNGFRFASRMDTHLNGPASGLDHPAARIFASYRKGKCASKSKLALGEAHPYNPAHRKNSAAVWMRS